MKRYFLLVGFILFLSGCSAQEKVKLDKNNPTTVTIWHYYSGEQKKAFDSLITEFNYSYGMENGIIVQGDTTTDLNILIDELEASFEGDPGSKDLPDAFFTYSDSAYPLAFNGLLASFDDYIGEKDLEGFVEDFIEEGRFLENKELYIMPVAKASEVIMLNKTDFDLFINDNNNFSTDHLKTWEGISELSEAYYEWSGGKAFFGIDSLANFIISSSMQNGVAVLDNINGAGLVNIDEKAMRKIWETYYINTIKGYFGIYNNFRSDDVKTGVLLAYLGSTASGAYFPSIVNVGGGNEYSVEMEAFVMPVFEGGNKVAIQQGAGIAMVKSTPEKEYAVSMFIKWFTEPDRNIGFSLASSYLPVTKAAIEKLRNDNGILEEHTSNKAVLSTLKVAVLQIDLGYQMFLTKPFETSYETRILLQTALRNYSDESRNRFQNDLENGADYEELLSEYVGEDAFQEFLSYMKNSVLN